MRVLISLLFIIFYLNTFAFAVNSKDSFEKLAVHLECKIKIYQNIIENPYQELTGAEYFYNLGKLDSYREIMKRIEEKD